MKINRLFDALSSFKYTQEKPDSEGQSPQHHQDSGQSSPDRKKQQTFEEILVEAVTDKQVDEAMLKFSGDPSNQASGLNLSKTGRGPGLKVVLKDGSGAVVRQFSGEEFVRLRETAAQDFRKRGKILDQKL